MAENPPVDGFQKKMQDFIAQYNAVGHVPFKEKDKLYKEYHDVMDKLYKHLRSNNAKRHMNNFKSNLKSVAALRPAAC